jgi:hypothetical protein
MKECKQCKSSFEVTDQDRQFYDRVSPEFGGKKYPVPEPTLCPGCRQQRRAVWRNERFLYHRNSDLSNKPLISIYSPDKSYTIYRQDEWWSDSWNPLDYGQEYDFNRPFFEQFDDLLKKVPRYATLNKNCENCDFSPWMVDCKDCYLSSGGKDNEQCYYTQFPIRSEYCFDCAFPDKCKYCYECINTRECYECFFSLYLDNCNGCYFCYDLIGCRNCFGCVSLHKKEYHIFNKRYSKEEYEKIIGQYNLSDPKQISEVQKKVNEMVNASPHRNMRIINSENCTGDYIKDSRNTHHSFNVEDCEDCKFINDNRSIKDCYDFYVGGFGCELCYEGISHLRNTRALFSSYCWDGCSDIYYCDSCIASSDLFGCVGLQHKKHCVFNKQYSKEEYEELVPRIIENMMQSNSWGEFFPVSLSPFGYNETTANEYFPLTKGEVLGRSWKWCDFEPPPPDVEKTIPADRLPDSINDIPDDVLNWAIKCEKTQKPFKITKQELAFYRQYNLPVPRLHPFERHLDRLNKRPPRNLWLRTCGKCGREIQATYAEDQPEQVYCEECYLKEVY